MCLGDSAKKKSFYRDKKERKKLLDFGKLSTLALCNSLDEAWEWGLGHFSTAGFGAD